MFFFVDFILREERLLVEKKNIMHIEFHLLLALFSTNYENKCMTDCVTSAMKNNTQNIYAFNANGNVLFVLFYASSIFS